MKEQIAIHNVTKRFQQGRQSVDVLRGVNLGIESGSFTVLVGPSGSGKTTLLNIIAGLDRPTSGRVVVDGLAVNELSDMQVSRWRAAHVGFIFQSYNLLHDLKVWRNVEVPLLLFKLSATERRKRVDTALELVGLLGQGKYSPGQLSGGQQQRVAIARAIVSDPGVLICDEPTGDLDRETASQVMELLRALNRDLGKTIIMVTHDPIAGAYGDRQVRLDKGLLLPMDQGIQ
jgi:putative ABC transport system ATP-binding protein